MYIYERHLYVVTKDGAIFVLLLRAQVGERQENHLLSCVVLENFLQNGAVHSCK